LATHGFFLGSGCSGGERGSRGIGGVTAATGSRPASPQATDPVLSLSGLAFAGANRRSETGAGADDGILTAEEIASMNLTGVDWVVLSACDTGVGRIQAREGVVGLRRAFQIAGAGTLIMSLWPVEDRAAREWMCALYQTRLDSPHVVGAAQAVREASVRVLRERRAQARSTHPFYWAAFVAAGDWN
jgi:CHAT domain-containing protein